MRGIDAYAEVERNFSIGDRVQFTAPNRELHVANRALGTIDQFTQDGLMAVKMDNGKTVSFDPQALRHFDHGYAVTSHSSQGVTADRVLINVARAAHPDLFNSRFAYVAVSRASFAATIFTNDISGLPSRLDRDVAKSSAMDFSQSIGRTGTEQAVHRAFNSGYEFIWTYTTPIMGNLPVKSQSTSYCFSY